ncbi:MAG: hypothetical protein ACREU9_06515 [Gammaproteobacteria bacterium]
MSLPGDAVRDDLLRQRLSRLYVTDWPRSSFHDYAARGIYPVNWGCEGIFDVCAGK